MIHFRNQTIKSLVLMSTWLVLNPHLVATCCSSLSSSLYKHSPVLPFLFIRPFLKAPHIYIYIYIYIFYPISHKDPASLHLARWAPHLSRDKSSSAFGSSGIGSPMARWYPRIPALEATTSINSPGWLGKPRKDVRVHKETGFQGLEGDDFRKKCRKIKIHCILKTYS